MNLTTAAVGGYSTAPSAAQGVLEAELNGTGGSISMLANAIADLEAKMEKLLRPAGPEPAAPSGGSNQQLAAVAPTPSAMVLEVQKLRTHIDVLTYRVGRIFERLEA
jgi:hypothetical protein